MHSFVRNALPSLAFHACYATEFVFSMLFTPHSLFPGGSVHWQRENKPPAERFSDFYSRAPSAEIEMTSYVLLALLNRAKLTPEDLSYISRIVYWLIKQQNPYGGFSSSQVTTGCDKKKVSWSSTVCKLNLEK